MPESQYTGRGKGLLNRVNRDFAPLITAKPICKRYYQPLKCGPLPRTDSWSLQQFFRVPLESACPEHRIPKRHVLRNTRKEIGKMMNDERKIVIIGGGIAG